MESYVISLASALDRRQHIIREFEQTNKIAFHFFDAVTPDKVLALAEKFNIELQHTNLTKVELACLFSHLSVWQTALDQGLEYVAVFEDDIYLGKNIKPFFNDDIWQSVFTLDPTIIKLEIVNVTRKMVEKEIIVPDQRKLRKLVEPHMCTGGYLINRAAILALLQYIQVQSREYLAPIDVIMFEECVQKKVLTVYQLTPALCIQSTVYYDLFGKPYRSDSVLPSQIEHTRKKSDDEQNRFYKLQKRNLVYRIKRELLRPFRQLSRYIKQKFPDKKNEIGFR